MEADSVDTVFKCDKCGLCCRKVGKFPSMKEFDRGDGACKHLKDDNTCAIYETRPTICNVDRLYEERFKDDMTRDEWYRLQYEGCRELKEDHERNQRRHAESGDISDERGRTRLHAYGETAQAQGQGQEHLRKG